MKRRSTNTTLLAVAIAVVLFLIANHFDNRAPWQPDPPVQVTMKPAARSTSGEPLRTIDSAGRCDAAELEMQDAVANAQSCRTDDDCTIFDYGYPIQCMTSVAKSEISALRLKYRDYEASCRFRVYYDCPTEGTERIAVCRNNQCAVELDSIDALRDETLHHIGIE